MLELIKDMLSITKPCPDYGVGQATKANANQDKCRKSPRFAIYHMTPGHQGVVHYGTSLPRKGYPHSPHTKSSSPVHTKLGGSMSQQGHQDLKCSNSSRLQRHLAQHSSSQPLSPIYVNMNTKFYLMPWMWSICTWEGGFCADSLALAPSNFGAPQQL